MKTFEEDNYLFTYLEKDIEQAKKDIKTGKGLTQKGAIAMLLKGMYNHIAHLDENMVTKKEFMLTKQEFNRRFDEINLKFDHRFDAINLKFDHKFDAINLKFDAIDLKFEGSNNKFDMLNSKFNELKSEFKFIKWLIVFGFILLAALHMILAFV